MDAKRVFLIQPGMAVQELEQAPDAPPEHGFVWLAFEREPFVEHMGAVQEQVRKLTGFRLLDLHMSDLRNAQLPSHFDYTSNYDVLVFRRLTEGGPKSGSPSAAASTDAGAEPARQKNAIFTARKLQTAPVGFAVFDQVLISVHPAQCGALRAYAAKLKMLAASSGQTRPAAEAGAVSGPARLPDSPAELMLRIVGAMVDDYLDLRKIMSRQLERWQQRLMRPNSRFDDWEDLLLSRQALHHVYDICDDQRSAISRWIDILEDWPKPEDREAQHRHDQLLVRSRDVMEHIERVLHHVRMLEQSAETAVQIHFNIQSNRTNDVMRVLTAVTAVFLPLNLIAGIFGMNFEYIPWLHSAGGFWWSLGAMALIAIVLLGYFARKRYLSSNDV
ncbi:MAG: magnesium transporter CorA family protein [Candidimonas sp.]